MEPQENISMPTEHSQPAHQQLPPTNFDERLKKALDFGADSTKQLITVAVGVIAFTITFSKDFIGATSTVAKVLACCGWGFYLLSVLCGLVTLNGLTGQLEPGDDAPSRPSIWAAAVNRPMMGQWITFMLALILTLIFGVVSIFSREKPVAEYKFTFPNSTINITPPATAQQQSKSDKNTGAVTHGGDKTTSQTEKKTDTFATPAPSPPKSQKNTQKTRQSIFTRATGDVVFTFNYGKGDIEYLIPANEADTFRQRNMAYDQQQQESLNSFLQFLEKYRQ